MNASVLYIESPPGVGFSQSNFSEASDKSTTKASLAALVDFFHVKFPEYAANDFYLSGESYAGIYIPNLATAILVHNVKYDQNINLKGFILGNGCTLGAECTEADSIPEGFSTFEF
jgi:carboxypeptidase C (cathepsin A)